MSCDSVRIEIAAACVIRDGCDPRAELELAARSLSDNDRISAAADPGTVQLVSRVRLKRRGGRTTLTPPTGSPAQDRARPDPVLIGGLRRAHALKRKLGLGERIGHDAASPATRYEQRLLALAFLAPELQIAILTGRQPHGLSLQDLILNATPLAWADQRDHLVRLAQRA